MDAITIDKSKAKKKQTIHGTSENETINGSKYADKIYTGGGYDKIYPGKGKDTIIINDEGNKEIYIEAGTGNKTLVFDKKINMGTTIHLDEDLAVFEFIKSGNDLIIKTFYEKETKKGLKYLFQNLTIKEYFSNPYITDNNGNMWLQEGNGSIDKIDYLMTSQGVTVLGNKQRKFTGTEYDDYILGTKKADTITTGTHKDTIIPGKGDDTITLDDWGHKNIEINNGDGHDTITYNSTQIITANFAFDKIDSISVDQDGTDLIIARNYDAGTALKNEITTVKDYYDSEGNPASDKFTININGNALSTFKPLTQVDLKAKSANTISFENGIATINGAEVFGEYTNVLVVGGSKADKITSYADNAHIFAGAGNDTIKITNSGNAHITGGKGNDTITLNTTGEIAINHKKGDGSDVINITKKPSKVTINIESGLVPKGVDEINYYAKYFGKINTAVYSGKLGFKKSGNDLVFSIPSGKKAETITIKDYLAEENYMPDDANFIMVQDCLSEEDAEKLSDTINSFGIWAEGKYNETQKATVFDSVGAWRNIYKFSGKGKAIFNGKNEDDIYMTTLNKKTEIYINNKYTNDSDSDELMINANHKNVKALFNVGANTFVKVTENSYSNDLLIFNKASLTAGNVKNLLFNDDKSAKGVIALTDFWSNDGNIGTGYIENVTVSTNIVKNMGNLYNGGYKKIYEINTANWVNEVASKVSAWLNSGGRSYTDAFDALERGTAKEVSALLKIYQNASNTAQAGVYD